MDVSSTHQNPPNEILQDVIRYISHSAPNAPIACINSQFQKLVHSLVENEFVPQQEYGYRLQLREDCHSAPLFEVLDREFCEEGDVTARKTFNMRNQDNDIKKWSGTLFL